MVCSRPLGDHEPCVTSGLITISPQHRSSALACTCSSSIDLRTRDRGRERGRATLHPAWSGPDLVAASLDPGRSLALPRHARRRPSRPRGFELLRFGSVATVAVNPRSRSGGSVGPRTVDLRPMRGGLIGPPVRRGSTVWYPNVVPAPRAAVLKTLCGTQIMRVCRHYQNGARRFRTDDLLLANYVCRNRAGWSPRIPAPPSDPATNMAA